jgi:hypothetical protein
LDIVEGEDSVEGSVAKAEKDAKEFASAEVLTEKNRAESAESGLQSAINTEKGRVDAILSASDADKDSFAEIVQLINSVDTESDTAFASYVLSNNSALSQEVSDRQAAVSAEESRAEGEEARIEGLLTQEVSDRQAAVSAEESRAEGEESRIEGLLSSEVSRAEAAEAGILDFFQPRLLILEEDPTTSQYVNDQVGNEEARAMEEESRIVGLVSAEQTRAEAAEIALDGRVGDLEFRWPEAQSDLETAISAEQTRAQAEEASLRSDMESGLDSHSTVMTGLQSQISALDTSRQNAESALSGRLDVLEAVLPRKETMEVSSEQASQGYIDLSMQAMEHSVHMFVGPLYAVEGIDYSVSVEGGVTRITFMGQLASGGVSEITSGYQVQVKYMK